MIDFFKENLGTIIVGAVLLVILASALIKLRKDKKEGKGCGCGCAGCPSQGMCHGNTQNIKDK